MRHLLARLNLRALALWFLLTSMADAVVLFLNFHGEIGDLPLPTGTETALTAALVIVRAAAGNGLWLAQPYGWMAGAWGSLFFAALGLVREAARPVPGLGLAAAGAGLLYHGIAARWLHAGPVRRLVFLHRSDPAPWLGHAGDVMMLAGVGLLAYHFFR
jgi:hypothetical protein